MENKIIDEDSGELLPNNKPWQFKKGHNLATGRPKGSLNKTTELMNEFGIDDVKKLKKYMDSIGISRFIKEMESLEGKDYIVAYLGLLPYVRGKVANIEVSEEEGTSKRLQTTHTITIKDMRNNTTSSIELD